MSHVHTALLSFALLAACSSNNGPGTHCGASSECQSGAACVIVNNNTLGECHVLCVATDGGGACDAGDCLNVTAIDPCDAGACTKNVCQ